jgi:hypothetical protein
MNLEEKFCPFCKRPIILMMKHHPIPKSLGGKKKIESCRDCHKAIHLCFTLKELAEEYHTVNKLLSRSKFRRMVAYIKRQDPNHKVRMLRPMKRQKRR